MRQLLLVLAALCLPGSAATMTITLVNLQTGSLVEGAEATISHTGQQLAEFVSGADGKFSFPIADGTRFTVKVQKAGFVDPLDHAGLGSEYKSVANSSHSIVIGLLPTAVIEGTLRDGQGRPLPGIAVAALRRDQKTLTALSAETVGKMSLTDDEGRYRFFGLIPGVYTVATIPNEEGESGTAHGFVCYPGKKEMASASYFDLDAGAARRGVDFTIVQELAGSLALTVAEVPEEWKGGRVMASLVPRAGMAHPLLTVSARADSIIKFDNVPPGEYQIVARGPIEAGDLIGSSHAMRNRFGSGPITIRSGEISEASIPLRPSIRVSGRVIPEDGAKRGSECGGTGKLTLQSLDSWPSTWLPTIEMTDHNFAIEGIPPGRFEIILPNISPWCYVSEVQVNDKPAQHDSIELPSDSTINAKIAYHGGEVSGALHTATPRRDGDLIIITNQNGPQEKVRISEVDSSGRFAFTGVSPGIYKLLKVSTQPAVAGNSSIPRQSILTLDTFSLGRDQKLNLGTVKEQQ